MKIGILGGTFNPVHLGHLLLGQEAQEVFGLDRVYFVPAFIPPHKQVKGKAAAGDRLEMVRLAVKGNKKFFISDYEITKKGKSYSIDTIKEFRRKFSKNNKIFFIAGMDSMEQLKDWKDIRHLLRLCRFIVFSRPGYKMKKKIKYIELKQMPLVGISSTSIRRRVKRRKSIKYLVPEEVERYINRRRLYR